MAENNSSFDCSDDTKGQLVYAGTGEKAFMVVSLTATDNCAGEGEIFAKGSNNPSAREGTRALPPGQPVTIRDWFLSGNSAIYLYCNAQGKEDGNGCTVENFSVYYTDDTPGTY